jgi:hypothetical protein
MDDLKLFMEPERLRQMAEDVVKLFVKKAGKWILKGSSMLSMNISFDVGAKFSNRRWSFLILQLAGCSACGWRAARSAGGLLA